MTVRNWNGWFARVGCPAGHRELYVRDRMVGSIQRELQGWSWEFLGDPRESGLSSTEAEARQQVERRLIGGSSRPTPSVRPTNPGDVMDTANS